MTLSTLYGIPPSRLLGVPPPASIYFDALILRELQSTQSTAGRVSGRRDRLWPLGARRRA